MKLFIGKFCTYRHSKEKSSERCSRKRNRLASSFSLPRCYTHSDIVYVMVIKHELELYKSLFGSQVGLRAIPSVTFNLFYIQSVV